MAAGPLNTSKAELEKTLLLRRPDVMGRVMLVLQKGPLTVECRCGVFPINAENRRSCHGERHVV